MALLYTRNEALTRFHALTSSNTSQQMFAILMSYLATFDAPMVVGLNSVLGRISSAASVISVPSNVLSGLTVAGSDASFPDTSL